MWEVAMNRQWICAGILMSLVVGRYLKITASERKSIMKPVSYLNEHLTRIGVMCDPESGAVIEQISAICNVQGIQ